MLQIPLASELSCQHLRACAHISHREIHTVVERGSLCYGLLKMERSLTMLWPVRHRQHRDSLCARHELKGLLCGLQSPLERALQLRACLGER